MDIIQWMKDNPQIKVIVVDDSSGRVLSEEEMNELAKDPSIVVNLPKEDIKFPEILVPPYKEKPKKTWRDPYKNGHQKVYPPGVTRF